MEEEGWTEYDGGAVQEWHRSASRIRVAPNVAVIPEGAFEHDEFEDEDCPKLRAVDLSNVRRVSARAFMNCHLLEHIIWTTASAVEIGEEAFMECTRLRAVELSNVAKIGRHAFFLCHALISATIPSSVAEVEDGAFESCKNLTEVVLGEGIERIGVGAFYGCKALVRINIPASVTDIGLYAFERCSNLMDVELNKGLEHVGEEAFKDCTSLLRISIPTSVTDIGDQAFHGCSSLAELELNEGLRHIGMAAFRNGTSLASVRVPSTTVTVGRYAFWGCDQLRRAELQEGVRTIEAQSFYKCHSLERVTIPSSVTFVGQSAFSGCHALSEVILREGVHLIESGAFFGCSTLEHINTPPVALVIKINLPPIAGRRRDIPGPSCQVLRTAMLIPYESGILRTKRLVASKWMQCRSLNQVEEVEAKVNEIIGRQLIENEMIRCIREWFAYYDLMDAATLLELAIWRSNMHYIGQDAETRQAIRRSCGSDMNVIIPGVLPFLEC